MDGDIDAFEELASAPVAARVSNKAPDTVVVDGLLKDVGYLFSKLNNARIRNVGSARTQERHYAPSRIVSDSGTEEDDLDILLQRLYSYWLDGGFVLSVSKRIAEVASVAFVALFLPAAVSCVRWGALVSDCNDHDSCSDTAHYFTFDNVRRPTGVHIISLLFLISGCGYLLWFIAISAAAVLSANELRLFNAAALNIPDDQVLQVQLWDEVVHRLNTALGQQAVNGSSGTETHLQKPTGGDNAYWRAFAFLLRRQRRSRSYTGTVAVAGVSRYQDAASGVGSASYQSLASRRSQATTASRHLSPEPHSGARYSPVQPASATSPIPLPLSLTAPQVAVAPFPGPSPASALLPFAQRQVAASAPVVSQPPTQTATVSTSSASSLRTSSTPSPFPPAVVSDESPTSRMQGSHLSGVLLGNADSSPLAVVEPLYIDAQEVAARILRKDNFLTDFLVHSGLAFSPSGARTPYGSGTSHAASERTHLLHAVSYPNGNGNGNGNGRTITTAPAHQPVASLNKGSSVGWPAFIPYTQFTEWALGYCLLGPGKLPADWNAPTEAVVRRRALLLSVLLIIFAPFLLSFLIIYYGSHQLGDIYASEDYVGVRKWSYYALRLFRNYDELPHVLQHRLQPSFKEAQTFLAIQKPSLLAPLAETVRLLASGLLALMAIIMLLNENAALYLSIWGRNPVWYATILGVLIGITTSAGGDASASHDLREVEASLLRLASHTQYLPREWVVDSATSRSNAVRSAVASLFPVRVELFLREIASVATTPAFLLWYLYPNTASCLQLLQQHAVRDVRVGTISSSSLPALLTVAADSTDQQLGGSSSKINSSKPGNDVDMAQSVKAQLSLWSFQREHPSTTRVSLGGGMDDSGPNDLTSDSWMGISSRNVSALLGDYSAHVRNRSREQGQHSAGWQNEVLALLLGPVKEVRGER